MMLQKISKHFSKWGLRDFMVNPCKNLPAVLYLDDWICYQLCSAQATEVYNMFV